MKYFSLLFAALIAATAMSDGAEVNMTNIPPASASYSTNMILGVDNLSRSRLFIFQSLVDAIQSLSTTTARADNLYVSGVTNKFLYAGASGKVEGVDAPGGGDVLAAGDNTLSGSNTITGPMFIANGNPNIIGTNTYLNGYTNVAIAVDESGLLTPLSGQVVNLGDGSSATNVTLYGTTYLKDTTNNLLAEVGPTTISFSPAVNFDDNVSIGGDLIAEAWTPVVAKTNYLLWAGNIIGASPGTILAANGSGLTNLPSSSITNAPWSLLGSANVHTASNAFTAGVGISGGLTLDTMDVTTLNATALAVTGDAIASGIVKGTNGLATAPLTVATLPGSPVPGQMVWVTDAITSRGGGDYCYYDGAEWRTRENVIATANHTNFIFNAWSAGLNVNNSSRWIASIGDWGNAYLGLGTLITFGNSGSGSGTGYAIGTNEVCGSYFYLDTGTTTNGYAHSFGRYIVPSATVTNAIGGSFWVPALCDGTERYWAIVSMTGAATGGKPTRGCGFLYDMYGTWSHGLADAATNHWIAWTGNASSYSYADTGLTPSTTGGAPDRLHVILQSNVALFYTNGVLASAIATPLPASGIYDCNVEMVKTAGTTARRLNWALPVVYGSHQNRTIP